MKAREPASKLGKSAAAGFAAWRRAMQWQRAVNRALRPLGLTHTQLMVLDAVDRLAWGDDTDGVKQAAIAKKAGLDRSTTSTLVHTLEEKRLVSSDAIYGDDRAVAVLATHEGKRALAAAAPLVEAAAHEIVTGVQPPSTKLSSRGGVASARSSR